MQKVVGREGREGIVAALLTRCVKVTLSDAADAVAEQQRNVQGLCKEGMVEVG